MNGDLPPPPGAPTDTRNPDGSRSPNGSAGRGYDRVPPHSLEAEVSVLGAALLSRNAASEAVELLQPEHYYRNAHRTVFEAVQALLAEGEPIDTVTVTDWLARRDRLDEVGGAAAIHDLTVAVPTAANAAHYARIVREKALLRRLIDAGTAVARLGYEATEDAETVVDRAESLVYEVAQANTTSDYAQLKDLLNESFAQIEQLAERGSEVTGLATGFNDLDRLTAGLQPQNLVIIAARPAMGKSSLSLNISQYVSIETRRPSIIFSLEMSKLEIVNRLLSSEARIDSSRIRTGRLEDSDWRKLSDALGKLSDAPLFIDDTPSISLMEIRAKCRRLKQKHGLDLVIVDYLQLMQSHRRVDSRHQEVAEISRGLKMLAKELDVPVVALSQLSRQPESRTDKRPQLADLRESGCLTGETQIHRADTGGTVTIRELAESGERNIPVWALDDNYRIRRATMTHAFPSGVKPVFRLRLASGRTIRASANHPFLRVTGWARVDELRADDRIAVPRQLPDPDIEPMDESEIVMLAHLIGDGCFVRRQPLHYTNSDLENIEAVEKAAAHFGVTPRRVPQKTWWHVYLPAPYRLTHGRRNPICAWLDSMGLFGCRSGEKFLPSQVLRLPPEQLATFLGHLWATDGHVSVAGGSTARVHLYYGTKSRLLADGVSTALLRLGILSNTRMVSKKGYGPSYQVWVDGSRQQRRFLEQISVHGSRRLAAEGAVAVLAAIDGAPWNDVIPSDMWEPILGMAKSQGFTRHTFARAIEPTQTNAVRVLERPIPRDRLIAAGGLLSQSWLAELGTSDVLWDRVVSIDPDGMEPVYDATVPGPQNFIANNIVAHNSIEQDADIVGFIYRDEIYVDDSPDQGIAELIIAKHRNGATGVVKLAFLNHLTKFANLARGSTGAPGGTGGSGGTPTPI